MTFESFIQNYGYVALIVGAFFEGETVAVIGGFAAARGYLQLPWVIVCIFCGTLSSDQLFFFLGRTRGQSFVAKRAVWQHRAQRVQTLLVRHQLPVILGFRFIYGLRNVTPLVIGASGFPASRFVALNVLSAALWSVMMSLAGFSFGAVMERIVHDIKRYELWVAVAVLVAGAATWVILALRAKRVG